MSDPHSHLPEQPSAAPVDPACPGLNDAAPGAQAGIDPAHRAQRVEQLRKRRRKLITWRRLGEKPQEDEAQSLLLLWLVWLFGSWLVSAQLESPVPRVRLMVMAAAVGMMVIYPALRLGQLLEPRGAAGSRSSPSNLPPWLNLGSPMAILRDWAGLVVVLQAVLLALSLTAGWHIGQLIWIDLAMAAWSFLAAGLVAWGWVRPAQRTAAMLACMVLLFAEPMLVAISVLTSGLGSDWTLRLSPWATLWALSGPPLDFAAHPWNNYITTVGLAGLLVWAVCFGAHWRRLAGRPGIDW